MKTILKTVSTGKVQLLVYEKSSLPKVIVKPLIDDFFRLFPNASEKIIWISKLIPDKGYTDNDVLEKYLDEQTTSSMLLFTEAGILSKLAPTTGNISDLQKIVNVEREMLFDNNFHNLLFEPKMRKSVSSSNIFMHNNEAKRQFCVTYSDLIKKVITE